MPRCSTAKCGSTWPRRARASPPSRLPSHVQLAVARKVDGTNWRREAYSEAALSGTNAASRMAKLSLGTVTPDEGARIYAVFSADVTADMEIPYAVVFRSLAAPTVTPVAAG